MRKKDIDGFSLLELLLSLAIIGILVSLILPNIGKINDSAVRTIAVSNAQSVVSTINNGATAGVYWGESRDQAITGVIEGRAPEYGPFRGVIFRSSVARDPVWERMVVFDPGTQTALVYPNKKVTTPSGGVRVSRF
jgi:prepilin-type N-terminal cleavage/methylation domain-containing protein